MRYLNYLIDNIFKYPVRNNEKIIFDDCFYNENLYVYLDEPNTPLMKQRFGNEKVKNIISNIERADGQYGSWRYLYRNNKGEIIAVFQGVLYKSYNVLSNIYVKKEYRRTGIGMKLMNVIEKQKKNIVISNNLSKSGFKFMEKR